MDKLKVLFGDGALTFDKFLEALGAHPEIKLADLASGEYVSKAKYDTKAAELATANNTIKSLQDAAAAFDGVSVEALRGEIETWKKKYATDIEELRLSSAAEAVLVKSGAKNPKLVRGLIDFSKLKLDGETVLGLSEQLTALKESDAYLFAGDDGGKDGGGQGAGSGSGTGMSSGTSGDDLSKMSDEEYYAKVFNKN